MNPMRLQLPVSIALGFWIAGNLSASGLAQEPPGKAIYDRWCAECHGYDGAGDGSAADHMLPPPRDFTAGIYQIRTTTSGALPRDEDLVRMIEEGMPGTAMPGWRAKFNGSQIRDLVEYIKSFAPAFEVEETPPPLEFGSPPGRDAEALAEGRDFYERIECWKCHGQAGRGDGPSAPTLQDDWDDPIRAADLTENWNFNGGGRVEDIYRRLRTGMDGTPMPSFSDLIDAGFMTDEQLWHLAQYVRSLSPERPPRVRDVVRVVRTEGELPATPDDTVWANVERFYFPLVAQIIEEDRWFAPTVDGVWVSGLHNGDEIALRVVWNDPSESPDSAWHEWQERVVSTIFLEGDEPARDLPDRLTVQFPTSIPTGRERPYFLFGDSRRPVYLWEWRSEPEGWREAEARGLGAVQAQPDDGQTLSASATWEDGQWRLLFRRSLATADSAAELQFATGEPIPIAFFAWDGSNGEAEARMAVSSWYAIYLEEPTPASVYISPIVAIVLTAGLGLLVVWRAQRREAGT